MPEAGAQPADDCPRCGASFDCGIASGRCWCAQLPALPALPAHLGSSCLCPACLRELTLRDRPGGRGQDGPRR